jgi:flagella basal body P-ring formation protein FlgA
MKNFIKLVLMLILPAAAFAVITAVGAGASGGQSVVVAARSIEMGEVIKAEDLREEVSARHDARAVSDASSVVGMRAARPIGKGNIVKASYVDDKVSVRKGETILLIARRGNLKLTAKGRAIEDGVLGSEVKVENSISGKILNAKIIGPGEAVVNF